MQNATPVQPLPTGTGPSTRSLTSKLPGQPLRLLVGLLELPFRYLFGRDLFISYSRRDSRKYAPNLALALQKRMPKLSFYLDRWIAPPSGKLPLSLRLQLRWSSILVVVCTERAVASPFVQDEVARFAEFGRKVLTVDVDGNFSNVRGQAPWVDVSGADPEEESGAAVEQGEPSENVIERIIKMVEFTTQDRRLRRAVWGTLAFVLLSVGGIGAYGYNASKNAKTAQEAAAAANANAVEAEQRASKAAEQEKTANEKTRAATERAEAAQHLRDAAQKAQGVAEGLRVEAEKKAGEALEKERAATAEAQKQQDMALARRLTAENNLAADPQSDEFEKKILLTIESMHRFPSLEAFSNLVEGIRSMPTPNTSLSFPANVSELTFSPDGKYMATLAGGVVWLRHADAVMAGAALDEPLSREGERINSVAFSPDSKYLAAAHLGGVRLWLVGERRELAPISGKGRSILFGGGSNFIAVVKDELARGEGRSDVVGVWQLEGDAAREVTSVTVGGEVSGLSFSSESKFFTTVSTKDTDIRLAFWNTTGDPQTKPVTEPKRLGGEMPSAGLSPNAKYLWSVSATADLSYGILQKAGTGETELNGFIGHEFSPDGRFLITTDSDHEKSSRSRTEVWDISRDSLKKLRSLRMAHSVYKFSPDGERFAQVIGRNHVKVWNTLSGQLVAYVDLAGEYKDLAFTPDARFLAVAADQKVTLWPIDREWKSGEFDHPRGALTASGWLTALSPDGKLMAVAGETNVTILDAANGREAPLISPIKTPCKIESVSFAASERLVARGSCGVWAWDPHTGQRIEPVGDLPESSNLVFSKDRKYAAAVAGSNVEVHELARRSNVVQLEYDEAAHPDDDPSVLAVAFIGGNRLAIARRNRIEVWNWRARRLLHSTENESQRDDDDNSVAAAFNEDSDLVTADMYEALIWNLDDAPRVVGRVELQEVREDVNFHTTLSPNGKFVATTLHVFKTRNRDAYNKTTVWQLSPADLVKNTCRRLPNGRLLYAEWKKEFGTELPNETCEGRGRPAPDDDQEQRER